MKLSLGYAEYDNDLYKPELEIPSIYNQLKTRLSFENKMVRGHETLSPHFELGHLASCPAVNAQMAYSCGELTSLDASSPIPCPFPVLTRLMKSLTMSRRDCRDCGFVASFLLTEEGSEIKSRAKRFNAEIDCIFPHPSTRRSANGFWLTRVIVLASVYRKE